MTWQTAFGVIDARGFLWWKNINDFDNGEVPAGYISLQSGHAGLGGPSPVEAREIPAANLNRIVFIFGRGNAGQERLGLMMPNEEIQALFTRAVEGLSTHK